MKISATITNSYQKNIVKVETEGSSKEIDIPGKLNGYGSSINGGELLMLALSTCYCNDVYREAVHKNIEIESVIVSVSGEFGGVGMPGRNITYNVNIEASKHSSEEINDFIKHVDTVAEIHNTLRQGVSVTLNNNY